MSAAAEEVLWLTVHFQRWTPVVSMSVRTRSRVQQLDPHPPRAQLVLPSRAASEVGNDHSHVRKPPPDEVEQRPGGISR